MEEESTPLANIMIEYGKSIGEKRGEAKSQAKMNNLIDEALKEDPTMSLAEFRKQISKNQNDG